MKVFIVEDDEFYSKLLEHHLSMNPEYDVSVFLDGKSLLNALGQNPDVITLDYRLPDYLGKDLLPIILEKKPHSKVVMVSGQDDLTTATDLIKNGAYDYLVKNDQTPSQIWKLAHRIEKEQHLNEEIKDLKIQLSEKRNKYKSSIIGNSAPLKNVFDLIQKTNDNKINVSINGETGTGKEMVASEIHNNSKLKSKNYVVVNISSLSPTLIESELFGHEAGSFTGANQKRIGYFEQANGGTLFLDEIAELPMNIQTKILRVIQEKEIVRVGGNKEIKTDFRLITATHKDLDKEVKENRFREDLFYRIKGLTIELPPLRERGQDIIILANHFIKEFCSENGMKEIVLSKEAKEKLLKYSFPGNVRELKSIIELACVLCDQIIEAEEIKLSNTANANLLEIELTMHEYEILIIKNLLQKYNSNVLKVADILDIGKSTIYRLMKTKAFLDS